ncbi:MAG: hypothetical protein OEO82_08490 [Gammaproteobacteria bacterium]|nr:hypothetical protein [Gammaproteobacteria bacterium]
MKSVITLLILAVALFAVATVDSGMTRAAQPAGPFPALDEPLFADARPTAAQWHHAVS